MTFFNFIFIQFFIFALFSLAPINSRNSDPGSKSRLFSPLHTTTVHALHFNCEKTHSAPSALIDSRRIAPTHAALLALSAVGPFFGILKLNSESHHGGIRT